MNNELPINPCPICGSTRLASTLALAHSTWASFWMVARVKRGKLLPKFSPFQRFLTKNPTTFKCLVIFKKPGLKTLQANLMKNDQNLSTYPLQKGLTFLLKLLRTVRDFLQKSWEGHILVAFSTMPKYVWLFFHPCSRSICQAALSLFYVVEVLLLCRMRRLKKG